MADPHVGDINFQLVIPIVENGQPVNLATVTDPVFLLQDPAGAVTTRLAVVKDDPSAGLLAYTTTSEADLDQPGMWRVQPRMTIGAWTGHADQKSFLVMANLD